MFIKTSTSYSSVKVACYAVRVVKPVYLVTASVHTCSLCLMECYVDSNILKVFSVYSTLCLENLD